jgi:hypothetical protein
MNGDEFIKNQPIRVYDNGAGMDRYTVVYMNWPYSRGVSAPRDVQTAYTPRFSSQPQTEQKAPYARCTYAALVMSAAAYHSKGFCQHGQAQLGTHLGKRITFKSLPDDCQQAVLHDLEE